MDIRPIIFVIHIVIQIVLYTNGNKIGIIVIIIPIKLHRPSGTATRSRRSGSTALSRTAQVSKAQSQRHH